MRVFDNPSHAGYGPVRRTWVILAGLGVLELDGQYRQEYGHAWDSCMAGALEEGLDEQSVKRLIVRRHLHLEQISPKPAP